MQLITTRIFEQDRHCWDRSKYAQGHGETTGGRCSFRRHQQSAVKMHTPSNRAYPRGRTRDRNQLPNSSAGRRLGGVAPALTGKIAPHQARLPDDRSATSAPRAGWRVCATFSSGATGYHHPPCAFGPRASCSFMDQTPPGHSGYLPEKCETPEDTFTVFLEDATNTYTIGHTFELAEDGCASSSRWAIRMDMAELEFFHHSQALTNHTPRCSTCGLLAWRATLVRALPPLTRWDRSGDSTARRRFWRRGAAADGGGCRCAVKHQSDVVAGWDRDRPPAASCRLTPHCPRQCLSRKLAPAHHS